jgi:molybdopterin/thiamine biosynthesis adenylyltransferase
VSRQDRIRSPQKAFQYGAAFSRNLGLVQPDEQRKLQSSTVAIAGLGGVGGVHLTTLARMGIGHFRLADFDCFEIENMNRQVGACVSTLGRRKTDVMAEILSDINPDADVTLYSDGVQPANVGAFLDGADVAVDALDYFAVDARTIFYRAAYARGVPVVAAGPIGCSVALLVFLPGGMQWHEYFAMDLAKTDVDRHVLFLIGTAPKGTQMSYLDRRYVDLAAQRGPSLALAVQLCAGVVAAEAMKLLLGRGRVLAAPFYQQLDPYTQQYVIGKLRWGNRGLVQRWKYRRIRKMLQGSLEHPVMPMAETPP